MFQLLTLLTFLLSRLVAAAPTAVAVEPPEVTLRQGIFTGVEYLRPGDKWNVKAFMGIPYAQPPVADLRLRPPLPVNDSTEHFDATRYGIECPQASLIPAYAPDTPGMSEDCLTINVFVPENHGQGAPIINLPVGVNIHGGAFNLGAGK